MRLREALESPGVRARIKSLSEIDGLSSFDVTSASPEELPAVEHVIRNYVGLLRNIEQRLEKEARERAANRMPTGLVLAMWRNELSSLFYASFRTYGEWVLQAVRTFGSAIPCAPNASTIRSAVERLKFGLRTHCERSVEGIEERIAKVREWNAGAFDSDDKLSEGEEIAEGFQKWRLSATTVVTGLIELAGITLPRADEDVLWSGLSGEDGDWIIGDVELLESNRGQS